MAHTPTPWGIREGFAASIEIYPLSGDGDAGLGTANSEIAEIDDIYDEYEDNAAFIVRAVNAFEANEALIKELVEALKLFVREYVELVESGDAGFWNAETEEKVIKARSALALAEARS